MSSVRPAEPAGVTARRRTAVLGVGNPILGDDGVGWRVIDALEATAGLLPSEVALDRLAVGGLALMERLVGTDHAILVDAVRATAGPPGTVTVVDLEQLPPRVAGHLDSSHDATLQSAILAGRAMGADLPAHIDVVGIEVEGDGLAFAASLTPPVKAAVEVAASAIRRLLAARLRAAEPAG